MGQKTLIIVTILLIIFGVFLVLFIIGRVLVGGRDTEEPKVDEKTKNLTAASDILTNPVVFENLEVEIEAEIATWVTKNSFTLLADSNTSLFGGTKSKQLWIIFDKDFKLSNETTTNEPSLGDNKKIRIVGVPRILDVEGIERVLGNPLDDPKLFLDNNKIATKWEYGIVVIGESAQVVEE